MKATCLLLILAMPAVGRADVVLDWNEVTLAAVRRSAATPPAAARALAMVHAAIYDAVNSVERTHQRFRADAHVPGGTSREAAAARAAFRVLLHLFPGERPRLESALAQSLAQVPDGAGELAGIELGDAIAEQIIAWRSGDGSQRRVAYQPGTKPGEWRPTPPDFAPAMLPQWSSVTPFGIAYASQFRPDFPPDLASAAYAHDLEEVRMLGAADSAVRLGEETRIAHFWADGPGTVTPPGHWNRIAQTVARPAGLSLPENARLFALLNVTLADAAIVCWDMKYTCNLWRPVTAIREADTDGNDGTTRDPHWRPLLDTPPFPSCTSGHSTFSGAAAQVLALFFGRDEMRFADSSHTDGQTRTYHSFSAAAEEAGRSRVYGGIHFEFDNRAGLQSGRAVARYIFERNFQPLSTPSSDRLATREVYRPEPNQGHTATGDTLFAPCPLAPVLCCEPVIYEPPPNMLPPQPTVTYYLVTGW